MSLALVSIYDHHGMHKKALKDFITEAKEESTASGSSQKRREKDYKAETTETTTQRNGERRPNVK